MFSDCEGKKSRGTNRRLIDHKCDRVITKSANAADQIEKIIIFHDRNCSPKATSQTRIEMRGKVGFELGGFEANNVELVRDDFDIVGGETRERRIKTEPVAFDNGCRERMRRDAFDETGRTGFDKIEINIGLLGSDNVGVFTKNTGSALFEKICIVRQDHAKIGGDVVFKAVDEGNVVKTKMGREMRWI